MIVACYGYHHLFLFTSDTKPSVPVMQVATHSSGSWQPPAVHGRSELHRELLEQQVCACCNRGTMEFKELNNVRLMGAIWLIVVING